MPNEISPANELIVSALMGRESVAPEEQVEPEAEPKTHEWRENKLSTPAQMIVDGTCPTCLRPLPHPKTEHEPKRERRTWSITVPKDSREDGAETLDVLLEEARKEMAKAGLPYGDAEAARFFVLSHSLALFVQGAEQILSDS